MKKLILALTLISSPAIAVDASSCYVMSDADSRAYCLAKAHNDPSRCYSIQEQGKRSMCLSEVRK